MELSDMKCWQEITKMHDHLGKKTLKLGTIVFEQIHNN